MSTPQRVIHIVENLDRGAVENWLLRMLEHGRRRGFALDWTFYCTLGGEGAMEMRARTLGAQVVHSPVPVGRRADFARALRAELARGHYQVLHCHHDLVNGLYLAAAAGIPICRRLAHTHNADEAVLTPSRWKMRLFRPVLRRLGLMLADRVVGISNHTLDAYLAGRPRRSRLDIVHYYGVDPTPFKGAAPDRVAFRRELDLASDAAILLFGGRLVPEKNPIFAVDVLAALRQRDPRAVALFAGTGSLEAAVADRAKALGVQDSVKILGWCDDLPAVMRCADWFILPRPEKPMEGFGLAVVEAQLAGLRLLVSRGLPDDPFLQTAVFRRLPLSAAADEWAAAATELLSAPAPSPQAALTALAASPMDMDFALDNLLMLHRVGPSTCRPGEVVHPRR